MAGSQSLPSRFSYSFIFYNYVGNYGIAIIIITIILRRLFFRRLKKLQVNSGPKIQPEMTNLCEKYKDDRDAINKAVMELYREHRSNGLRLLMVVADNCNFINL